MKNIAKNNCECTADIQDVLYILCTTFSLTGLMMYPHYVQNMHKIIIAAHLVEN